MIEAARMALVSGQTSAAYALAQTAVAELPPGPERAEALLLIAGGETGDFELQRRACEQAIAEAKTDARLLARARAARRAALRHKRPRGRGRRLAARRRAGA